MKRLRARATTSAEETSVPTPPDGSQIAVEIPWRADLAPQENLTMIKEPMRTETVTIVFVNLLQSWESNFSIFSVFKTGSGLKDQKLA